MLPVPKIQLEPNFFSQKQQKFEKFFLNFCCETLPNHVPKTLFLVHGLGRPKHSVLGPNLVQVLTLLFWYS